MFDPLVISFLNHFGDFLIIELVDILGLYPGYPETKPVSGHPWKLGQNCPKRKPDRIPSIYFQVVFTVSSREGGYDKPRLMGVASHRSFPASFLKRCNTPIRNIHNSL